MNGHERKTTDGNKGAVENQKKKKNQSNTNARTDCKALKRGNCLGMYALTRGDDVTVSNLQQQQQKEDRRTKKCHGNSLHCFFFW